MSINAHKAKKLTELAKDTFDKFVGEPPNHNFEFHNREEIMFAYNTLETMIMGYVRTMQDTKIKLLPINSTLVDRVYETSCRICCNCGNNEINADAWYCKICGKSLSGYAEM